MIDKSQMMDVMLVACPSFGAIWEGHLKDAEADGGDVLVYLALADLARHLSAMLAAGETERFHEIFDVVERWHCEGDGYVREAATVGLLEGLQNASIHCGTEPAHFEPYLRPTSRYWWDRVERFWSKGELLTEREGEG